MDATSERNWELRLREMAGEGLAVLSYTATDPVEGFEQQARKHLGLGPDTAIQRILVGVSW